MKEMVVYIYIERERERGLKGRIKTNDLYKKHALPRERLYS